ncbi:MAG TPA: hypothetical protein VH275_03550 [Solirubrobacterales bacterium]|jgi:hypothetical protein|nr:hypothetical protein [Solirubrobacterales bacterium]
MSFHVEVSSGHQHARVFNVDEAGLRTTVLEPWVAGLPFDFGEREWDPRESRLTVLEGPEMEGPDLAFGQGWSNAQRAAEDVTRPMLEAAEASAPVQAAAVIAASSLEAALKAMRGGRLPQPIHWSAAVERINGRDPEVTAVILVVKRPAADRP